MRYECREGPQIIVFGRLAPGVTLEAAQSELTAIGQRTATAFPKIFMKGNAAVVLPLVALFMMLVGLLASVGPALRGLRIHPSDALREE